MELHSLEILIMRPLYMLLLLLPFTLNAEEPNLSARYEKSKKDFREEWTNEIQAEFSAEPKESPYGKTLRIVLLRLKTENYNIEPEINLSSSPPGFVGMLVGPRNTFVKKSGSNPTDPNAAGRLKPEFLVARCEGKNVQLRIRQLNFSVETQFVEIERLGDKAYVVGADYKEVNGLFEVLGKSKLREVNPEEIASKKAYIAPPGTPAPVALRKIVKLKDGTELEIKSSLKMDDKILLTLTDGTKKEIEESQVESIMPKP